MEPEDHTIALDGLNHDNVFQEHPGDPEAERFERITMEMREMHMLLFNNDDDDDDTLIIENSMLNEIEELLHSDEDSDTYDATDYITAFLSILLIILFPVIIVALIRLILFIFHLFSSG